jgi:hypothetical protein
VRAPMLPPAIGNTKAAKRCEVRAAALLRIWAITQCLCIHFCIRFGSCLADTERIARIRSSAAARTSHRFAAVADGDSRTALRARILFPQHRPIAHWARRTAPCMHDDPALRAEPIDRNQQQRVKHIEQPAGHSS